MMKYYIYILYSNEAKKFYVGHSNNPWKRVNEHLENEGNKFTGKYKDWELRAVFYISEVKGDADKLEKLIKRQKSRRLIEMLVDPDFIPSDKLAQLVRVPHVRD
jgi:putative endonuclease